jgi:hypothetical protein
MLRVFLPAAFDIGTIRSPGALAVAGLLVGFGARLGRMHQRTWHLRDGATIGALDRGDRDFPGYRRSRRVRDQSPAGRIAMKLLLVSFVSGTVFALGLGISG